MRFTIAAVVVASASLLPLAYGQSAANSRQALYQTVPELNVDGVTLERALNFLRDSTSANIVVNWRVLESVGVAKETPITLQVKNLPMRKMLQLVLDQASPNSQLVYTIDSNVLQITTQEEADKQMVTKVYVVDDLIMMPNQKQAPTLNLGQTTQQAGQGGFSGGNMNGGGQGGLWGGNNYNNNSNNTQNQDLKAAAQQRGDELVNLIREVVRPNIWRENGGTASIRYLNPGKLIVTAPISVHEAIGGPVGNSAIRYGS